jgi:hypothetical protein
MCLSYNNFRTHKFLKFKENLFASYKLQRIKFAIFAMVEMIDLIEILYREHDSVHFDSWSILIKRHRVLFIEARPFRTGGREFSTTRD